MQRYFLAFTILFYSYTAEAQRTNLFRIIERGKFGFIDNKSNVIIKPEFSYAYDFSEGLAVARKEKKYGYIDKIGKWQIAPQYDFAQRFLNGFAVVTVKGKSFLISRNQKLNFTHKFDGLQPSNVNDLYWFRDNGKSGLCNSTGKILLRAVLYRSSDFEYNYAVVDDDVIKDGVTKKLTALLDTSGQFVIPFGKYDIINHLGSGFVSVEKYPDTSNKANPYGEVNLLTPSLQNIDCKFPTYPHFHYTQSEGLIKIFLPKKPLKPLLNNQLNHDDFYVAFADTLGNIVIDDSSFSQADDFKFGLAVVLKKGKIEIIDKNGNVISGIVVENFSPNYGTDKNSFKYEAQRYIVINKEDIKSFTFENNNSDIVICKTYDHKGNFKYACDIPYSIAYYNVECSPIKSSLENIKSKYNLQKCSGVFVNGLMCAVIENKLCYIDKKGKIVWKQTNSSINKRDVRYYSNNITKVTLKHKMDYKCGKNIEKLNILNLAVEDSTKNWYGIFNTTCDTINIHALEINWGMMQHGFYNFLFGTRPILEHRECGRYIPEEGLNSIIPPNHYLEFSTAKTLGCCRTLFKIDVKAFLINGNDIQAWEKINFSSSPIEGMITPEIYNDGWVEFVDDYYYRTTHKEY